jgi:hypothetical protein
MSDWRDIDIRTGESVRAEETASSRGKTSPLLSQDPSALLCPS